MKKIEVISFGYRCTSAGILKQLGIKNCSYPFDWIISRLNIIKHCINDNFKEFLKIENYEYRKTDTISYYLINDELQKVLICDELIYFNTFYQTLFNNDNIFIPNHISYPNDTYSHYLAMNHYNMNSENDYDYFNRCISRFNNLMIEEVDKLYVHISPTMSIHEYNNNKDSLIEEFITFHSFIKTVNQVGSISGLFILVVRTEHEYPITNYVSSIIENINTEFHDKECSINVLYTHNRFLDAGEIFYQNIHDIETTAILDFVREHVNSKSKSAEQDNI
jgi:hypothetical protein